MIRIPPRGALFKTGSPAPVSGHYTFARYLDGATAPAPTAGEMHIPLARGNIFPPINSAGKGGLWKLTRPL